MSAEHTVLGIMSDLFAAAEKAKADRPPMPCGSSCAACPASAGCHSDAGEFDPAEMAAFLAGDLYDPEDPR